MKEIGNRKAADFFFITIYISICFTTRLISRAPVVCTEDCGNGTLSGILLFNIKIFLIPPNFS